VCVCACAFCECVYEYVWLHVGACVFGELCVCVYARLRVGACVFGTSAFFCVVCEVFAIVLNCILSSGACHVWFGMQMPWSIDVCANNAVRAIPTALPEDGKSAIFSGWESA